MQETIVKRLETLTLDPPQTYRNITIFPLVDGDGGGVDYLTLGEALEQQRLTVTEVSEDGSVPHLQVVNDGDSMVLLLDGEELAGAKQNRVLNTTVLVAAHQSLTIPVSCTESGRWRHVTRTAYESQNVMERSIRARKNLAVSESLDTEQSYTSDQVEIWNRIEDLSISAGVCSETCAMSDVYQSQQASLDEVLQAFPPVPGQVGFLAVIDGEAAGLDLVSRAPAYARLHGKLVRSYVMAGLVRGEEAVASASEEEDRVGAEGAVGAAVGLAHAFLERAVRSEANPFKSVGCGEDYRLRGDRITGSALVLDQTVVHAAIFHLEDEDRDEDRDEEMSDLAQRLRFRMD